MCGSPFFNLQLRRGEKAIYLVVRLRILTFNAGDLGSLPVGKIRPHPLCGQKIKEEEEEEERESSNHGVTGEKWENHGDPNLHFW